MIVGIYHASAGHGHRVVAEAIYEVLLGRGISKADVILEDALNWTPTHFGKIYPQFYFLAVKYCPWLWGFSYDLFDIPWVNAIVRIVRTYANRLHVGQLLKEIQNKKPKVLISTHFLTAELFARAKREGLIHARLITVITDFHPHFFWINRGTDDYCIMSREGRESLIKRGVRSDHVHVTGIPVHPKFDHIPERKQTLKEFGLNPDRFTLLLTSGSFGLGKHVEILEALSIYSDSIQCLVVCGHNKAVYEELQNKKFAYPVKVFGFVDFMPKLMGASDMMIAKPGGATSSESLNMGLPIVIQDPIPGQESRNAHLFAQRQAAFSMKSTEDLRQIVGAILKEPSKFEQMKGRMQDLAKPKASSDIADLVQQSL